MSVPIWIKTVWHSDLLFLKEFFEKKINSKKVNRQQNHDKLPSMQRLVIHINIPHLDLAKLRFIKPPFIFRHCLPWKDISAGQLLWIYMFYQMKKYRFISIYGYFLKKFLHPIYSLYWFSYKGAQSRCSIWDLGRWFEPHQSHCVVSLSKTLYPLLSTGSAQETSLHAWNNVDCDVKHHILYW